MARERAGLSIGLYVHRGSTGGGESLRYAEQALAAGNPVLIYPGGTITRDLWERPS